MWYIMGSYEIEVYKMGGRFRNIWLQRFVWLVDRRTDTAWIKNDRSTWRGILFYGRGNCAGGSSLDRSDKIDY